MIIDTAISREWAQGGTKGVMRQSGAAWLHEWLVLALVIICSVTVLQRFAVPGSGGLLGLGFVVCAAIWFLALVRGHLVVDPVRLILFVVAVAALALTLFAQARPFSLVSFLMLLLLYLPHIAMRSDSHTNYILLLDVFQRVMILSGVAALVQIGIQFVLGQDWMFPFDLFLPSAFFIDGFNLRIPITDNLPYLKSTGLWFLEPSHLSQLIAIAIVIEISYFRRLWALVLFGAAYVSSFSGTGALLLIAMSLPLIIRIRQIWLFAPVIGFFLALPFFHDVPPFSIFLGRLEELNNPMASGSMRFLAPYWLVGDVLLANPHALIFGFGPGSVENIISAIDYAVQDSSWLKLLVEYGLIGCSGFFVFYLYALFRHSPDRLLSFACLVQFMFLGGYLNAFYVQFLHMILVSWPRLQVPIADRGRSANVGH